MDNKTDASAPVRRKSGGMKRRLLRREVVPRAARTWEEFSTALADAAETTSLEAGLIAAEELARAVLRDAGLPEHLGPFACLRDGGLGDLPAGWREAGPRALGPGVVGVTTLDGALRGRLPAREARAALVLRRAEGVRQAVGAGRTEDAAWCAVRLGREMLLLELDFAGWIKAAEIGDAIGRGGSKGGGATRQRDPEKVALRERVLAEARGQLARGSSKAAAASRLARDHELAVETIRGWLKAIPGPSRGARAKPGG